MTGRNTDDATLTKAEAADELGVSVRTVERYIDAGHLTAIKRRNGRVRVTEASVENFLQGELVPALAEGGELR